MTGRRRRSAETEKALAAKLYARRGESADWDETAVDALIAPQRGVVTSLRLPLRDFVEIQRAAKSAGQTVSEFIRGAIALRLRANVLVNALQVATGSSEGRSQATFVVPALEAGRTQNPGPDRTEVFPPPFANLTR
jgi:hypothetical protein